MFAIVRAHWIDVGGTEHRLRRRGRRSPIPGSRACSSTSSRSTKQAKLDETLLSVISDNIRFPESSMGDMRSQIAACRLADRRLDELFDKYGRDTILGGDRAHLRRDRAQVPQVVGAIPDGVYEAEAFIDDDGVRKDEPVPHPCARSPSTGAIMTIDLSGCSQSARPSINSRTLAGARVAYKALTGAARSGQRGLVPRARRRSSRKATS